MHSPETMQICATPRVAAIFVPPLCSVPEETVERKWRVVVDECDAPLVTIMPPAVRPRFTRPAYEERLILALAPDLVRNAAAAEAQTACDPFLYGIARSIFAGMRIGKLPPEPYLESLAPVIGEHLERFYPVRERRRDRRGLEPAKLSRVLALIDERLEASLAVEDLAAAVHLSPFHFGRMFCRSMGISPHAYITRRRIDRAKLLLAATDQPLAVIAREVGYRNQAHFTRVFHQVAGTTPRRYRVANHDAGESAHN